MGTGNRVGVLCVMDSTREAPVRDKGKRVGLLHWNEGTLSM